MERIGPENRRILEKSTEMPITREDKDWLVAEMRAIIEESMQDILSKMLREMGIKPFKVAPWVSQNKASKLVGRKRLERAMREGTVEFKKSDTQKRNSPVRVSMRDVLKLIKQPEL